jgi:hypothetical protein
MAEVEFDKVLIAKKSGSDVVPSCIVYHDSRNQRKVFLKVEEMSMDEIQELLKSNELA